MTKLETTGFDWHSGRMTWDTPAYRNTRKVRRCFIAECGASFRFDRAFQAWLKDGMPKTLGEAADEWRRLDRKS